MSAGEKRKRTDDSKDSKAKRPWQQDGPNQLTPFATGVFITCVRGKEHVATKDVLELFNDYADRHGLVTDANTEDKEDDAEDELSADIEASIADELSSMTKKSKPSSRFTALKTSTECVIFVKTAATIDPEDLVHGICTEAHQEPGRKFGGRFVRRMTPIVASADASMAGLNKCLEKALPKHFQGVPKTFKIEPTFRNHNVLNRDMVIPRVAEAITALGSHKVDLKKYDVLVMVEVIRGFIGIGIATDWEKFRKYNLSEIFNSVKQESQVHTQPDSNIGEQKALEE